jgi:hypothetical protein
MHSPVLFQPNRELQLQRWALLLNSLHETLHILADKWRFVICQRRMVYFETNLVIVKRYALESGVQGALPATWISLLRLSV